MARILEWFAFPPPGDHVLSELSAVTCLSYNACLIASLGFTNPFAMTRLWSMKGIATYERLRFSGFDIAIFLYSFHSETLLLCINNFIQLFPFSQKIINETSSYCSSVIL